jgi:hypothetical protein
MRLKTELVIIISTLLLGTSTMTEIYLTSSNSGALLPLSTTFLSHDDTYDLVIVTPSEFTTELERLVTHKESHGIKSIITQVEDILATYHGRDDAEKIKYFIKDALEQWNTTYVLFMGGRKRQSFTWYVPVRYVNLDDGNGYSEYLSDLYFADIYRHGTDFEDWDSNGNGIFAEFSISSKDTLDLHPDVSIGRLPCRNLAEVSILVDKIIDYENNAYGQPWFNKMMVAGGNLFPQFDDGPFPYEGEATCDVAVGHMQEFEVTKLYTSDGTLTSRNDIIQTINQGCGFVFTRANGGTDRVRIRTPDGAEFVILHNRDIPKLKNVGMYPIIILGECIHGKFDVSLSTILTGYVQQHCIPECIAWRLLRKSDGGGIATVTNTNICYGDPGDDDRDGIPDDTEVYGGWLAVEFCRLYGTGGISVLGDLHRTTIANYVAQFPVEQDMVHCKSVQEFILLGDPSLRIGGYP